jgi:hypothetical protein
MKDIKALPKDHANCPYRIQLRHKIWNIGKRAFVLGRLTLQT